MRHVWVHQQIKSRRGPHVVEAATIYRAFLYGRRPFGRRVGIEIQSSVDRSASPPRRFYKVWVPVLVISHYSPFTVSFLYPNASVPGSLPRLLLLLPFSLAVRHRPLFDLTSTRSLAQPNRFFKICSPKSYRSQPSSWPPTQSTGSSVAAGPSSRRASTRS